MSQIAAISSLSGLVGYWPCEETSGTSAADKASSPANAALSGIGGVLRAWNSPGGVGAVGLRPYSSSALTASAASKLNVGDTFTAGVFFRRRAAVTGSLMQRGDIYGALGAELLTDPGMESALITSGYNGWRDSIGTGSGAFADTAEHHGGSQSIRIDVNSSGGNAGVNQGLDSASPGRYTVSFWYKNDTNASGRMSLQVMYTPVAGGSVQYLQTGTTNVWSTSSNDALYGIANATTWTQVTLTFDLPETTGTGASGLRIILKRAAGYGGGVAYSFWVDDASLKLQTTTVGTHALVLTSGGVVQLLAGSGGAATIVASSDPAHPITDHLGWHSVVLTKNGSATAIYIDGIDRTVAGTNATLSANGTDLTWFSGTYGVQPVVGAHMFLVNRAITATEQSTIYAAANMLPDRATSPQIRVGMCQFTAEMNLANAAVEAAALRSLHVTSTREAFDWLVAESTQGTYDWSAFDTMVDAQVAQGLSIQAIFMPRTPFWARTPTSENHSRYVPGSATKGISVVDANNNSLNDGKGTNAYTTWRDRWITYIVAAVHRYKDRVHIWELGNECNMSIFWGPSASAPLFVDWYNAARTAILTELGEAASGHRIVMGGLARLRSEAGTTDAQSYTADEWLRAILDLGVADFDAIGYHPYIAYNNSPWSHNLNSTSLDNAHQVRDTLMEYNRTSVLVELNEFGWYTHNTTVAASSDGLTLPQSTITVADGTKVNAADPVASAGDLGGGTASGFYIETTNGWELFGHTGLVGNTLTGCTGGTGTIHTGSRISFGTNPLSETQQAQYVADSLAIVRDQFSAFCDTWTYFTAFETNISGGDAFAFCSAWYGTDFTKPKLMTKALAVAAQPYDTIDAGTTLPCAIYNPTPVTTTIIDPYNDPAGLTYVSNSSMAYWRGRYWAIMDGTTQGLVEGSTGQQIWLTTSTDGVTWTTAIQPFRDATYCNNPKTGTTLEWQPNLVVVNNQLWCSWSAADAFISILNDPTEKWTNYRLEYIDDNQVFTSSTLTSVTGGRSNRLTKDGQNDWIVFPSSNPIVLQDGRVAIPATAYSNTLQSTATTSTSTFVKARKYNMLLIVGTDGVITPTYLDTTAFEDFCAWEPFVVQNPAGHIYVFHRNLNMQLLDPDMMLVSVSYDNGATFSAAVSTEMLVPSTRGFARQVSPKRWVLAHVDHAQHSTGSGTQGISTGRRNGALFLSRRGSDDFVPGVNFSGEDGSVNYPQVITDEESIYVHYTSGTGSDVRRALKLIQFPVMDDDVCYVLPRRNNELDTTVASDPVLHAGSPAYYNFNGANKAVSQTTLAATTGITYTAWVQWQYGGAVIMDSRQSNSSAFGSVFMLAGATINSLNFLHGFVLPPGSATFLAATIDATAGTVTLRACRGGTDFMTATGYFKTLLFSGQPSDGETIAVNGVTYTFRTSASVSTDVAIGASTAATATNLKTALTAHSMSVFQTTNSLRLVFTRTDIATFSASSASSSVTVDTLPPGGGTVNVGYPTGSSSLAPYNGQVYEARAYDTALSTNNLRYLYNQQAATFGYATLAGATTAPSAALITYDASSPNPTEFPSIGSFDPAYCEVVTGTTLRIHGEGSAAVELPHGATEVELRFRLGALPTGTDRYTIATFGDASSPARLYIDAASPTTLSCNGVAVTTVASPLAWNIIQVVITAQKVTIGGVEQYFSGKPRLFLGSAYPEGLLATTKTLDHDVSAMQMSRSHAIPRPVPVIADIACWGDSLTYSQTTGDVQASPTWPQTLATTLGVAVYNGGQGAHGSAEVATRQGGLQPLVTLTGNQIPSGTTAAISLTAISPTTGWRTGNVASAGLNMHGSLAGVNGTLRHDLTNALANVFTFTPDAAPASTVSVPALTPFVGDEGASMRNRVNIIWVGTNNTSQPTAIVRDITSMIDNLPAGTTRYLVVSNTQNSMTTLNTALQAAFGGNYADLRSYLISDGLAAAGITPVSQDATDIANGNVPSSLKYDGTHFVQAAYNIIGAWFAQEITQRGWV